MCILCVASRWSRRIVTMLPWLIIPLIILWALSQLLPPTFRFEVTSPRLACVGVLLISLIWYELAMPHLSTWRARRSALLRERRRIEAQEAAKWRKEATRRCRNCLSAYRDQTPGGGKFMCTFCGHISKRPVLETPDGGVVPPGGSLGVGGGAGGNMQLANHNGTSGSAGSFLGSRSSRGWGGRGWPERGGWVSGGRGWARSKGWNPGGGWGSGSVSGAGGGPWNPSNWAGGSGSSGTSSYWGRGTPIGGGWVGSGYGYGGGLFGNGEGCMGGDAQQWGLFSILFHSISFLLFCVKWAWRRIWRREGYGDDGGSIGGRGRGGQKKGEDGGLSLQGSRGDKARRKAEEKRQARMEREQLEAEERRQREEVARLVQERRRLRDEKLEAEKETEREAAAERERELRREREAERRRHDKVKEREKESKEKVLEKDSEDSKQKKDRKDAVVGEKKSEVVEKNRGEKEKKGSPPVQSGDLKKPTKGNPRVGGGGVDAIVGHKGTDAVLKAAGSPAAVRPPGSSSSSSNIRYSSSTTAKGPSSGTAKGAGVAHQNSNASSFWSKGFSTGGKARKGFGAGSPSPVTGTAANNNSSSGTSEVPSSKHTESSASTWNRMPWNKVWGKSVSDGSSSSKVAPLPIGTGGFPNGRTISDTAGTTAQNGVKQASTLNGLSGSGVSDLSRPPVVKEVPQSSADTSHPRAWHRLFSASNSDAGVSNSPSPSLDNDSRQQQQQSGKGSMISPPPPPVPSVPSISPQDMKSLFAETESTKFLGHGFPLGSSLPNKPTAVPSAGSPSVHLPALSFTSLSPSSSSGITSATTVSGYTPLQQHPAKLGATSTNSSAPPVPTPIGKPVQMSAAHPPVSSPLHMPAPLQLTVPITSQNQKQSHSQSHSRVPQDQLPQMLEPWIQPPPLAPDNSAERSVGEKWQMWDSPQLDQIQLSSLAEPVSNWNYSAGNGFLEQQQLQQPKDTTTTTVRSQQTQPTTPEPVNPLPACLFSPSPALAPVCANDNLFGAMQPGGLNHSQSLWSENSAFESAMRIWDDADTHQRAPREFVDCITQEVMKDPVITADGHSYERAAIEQWLKTHDTSPRTGEVLPAPPGGYGSGIDKTLRPNHSLRGQIIEYKENMARFNRGSTMAESNSETRWSVGLGLGNSAWSTERPLIAGYYGTPGAQSVWSFNGSQNAHIPVLPEL